MRYYLFFNAVLLHYRLGRKTEKGKSLRWIVISGKMKNAGSVILNDVTHTCWTFNSLYLFVLKIVHFLVLEIDCSRKNLTNLHARESITYHLVGKSKQLFRGHSNNIWHSAKVSRDIFLKKIYFEIFALKTASKPSFFEQLKYWAMLPNDTRGRGSKIVQKSVTYYLNDPLCQKLPIENQFNRRLMVQ